MKFTLSKTIRYWWPVTVSIPDPANPGKCIKQTLKVLFEPKNQDAAISAYKHLEEIPDVHDRLVAERDMLAGVVKDWADVVDDDQTPMPFSQEALNAALQQGWFRTGLNRALTESLTGEEARLGN